MKNVAGETNRKSKRFYRLWKLRNCFLGVRVRVMGPGTCSSYMNIVHGACGDGNGQ